MNPNLLKDVNVSDTTHAASFGSVFAKSIALMGTFIIRNVKAGFPLIDTGRILSADECAMIFGDSL